MDNAVISPSLPAGRSTSRAIDWVFLTVLICITVATRIVKAGAGGISRDEGLFLFNVDSPTFGGMIDILRFGESHPPLFYVLMRLWRLVFGPSVDAAVALTVFLGAVQVPVVYLVGARMFSRRAGLIAAVLVAFSPALVYHAVLVRPYSLLPTLALVSTYYLWSGLSGGGGRAWLGYAVTLLLMFYVHNWTFVFLAAHWVVTWVWFAWFRGPWSAVRGWILSQAGLAAGYAPWLPVFLFQAKRLGHLPNPVNSQYELANAVGMLNATLSPFHKQALSALVAAVLIVAAVWRNRRQAPRGDRDDVQWAGVLLMAAIPFVAWTIALVFSAKTNLLHTRCLVIMTPAFLLAVAQVLATLSPPAHRALPTILVLALVLADMRAVALRIRFLRSNAREMAAAVEAQARPSDLVLICPESLASSFNFYFRPDNPQIDFPQERRVGAIRFDDMGPRWVDPRAMKRVLARLDQACREGRRVWLVVDRNSYLDDAPPPEISPPLSKPEHYFRVGAILTTQLRKYLIRLYGPADLKAVPRDPRTIGGEMPGSELDCLDVLLFKPSVEVLSDRPLKPSNEPAALLKSEN